MPEQFPLDEVSLVLIESTLHTVITDEVDDEGYPVLSGVSLPQALEFLSGYDPRTNTALTEKIDEVRGSSWSDRDLLRALIAEVRRLRELVPEKRTP